MLPPPEPGDIVGIFDAGAYGYTMSMANFKYRTSHKTMFVLPSEKKGVSRSEIMW